MRNGKIFRILSSVFVLLLLAVALPAAPAMAAESIDLNPEEGEIGDSIGIDGYDFTINSTIYVYFSPDAADESDQIDDEVDTYKKVKTIYADDVGEVFDYSFNVPSTLNEGSDDEDVHGGQYYVYVTYGGSKTIQAVAEFTVIAGEITLSPTSGVVETEVRITGTNFDSSRNITVEYDNESVSIERGDSRTNSGGDFTSYIVIPPSTADDHTITVTDTSGSEAKATFTVEPEIAINPTSGSGDTDVTVTGSGFGGSRDVTITFDNTKIATSETDSEGNFTETFTVPVLGPGTYDVEAVDDGNNSDIAEFAIIISASISPTTSAASPGNVSTELTVSGTGFNVNSTVTIRYDTAQVTTTTTDTRGVFSASFTVPQSERGEHIVAASDGSNTRQFTFVMESRAPQIPPPLKPEMGIKAEALTYFDWEDVTDASGVTYTLQIASDEEFATIVLEKTGLTESEYTLTKEERLESVSKNNPYYWHVKAVDGASNKSGWSGTGTFYVGFSLNLPQWSIYLLLGILALALGAVGFWAGKRTAH